MKSSQTNTQTILHFNDWSCVVNKTQYADNKRTALQLIDAEDGLPICMATVNIPDEPLEDDEVLIKDWSENQGIYRALRTAGIVGDPLGFVPTGYVEAINCKLLI